MHDKQRRKRLESAVDEIADNIDRSEYLDGVEAAIDGTRFAKGWWAEHKLPTDKAAEIEEDWKFPDEQVGRAPDG